MKGQTPFSQQCSHFARLCLSSSTDTGLVVFAAQMIGDNQRGSAWTRALLGLPASEIHLCGDATALELVRRLCKDTGEELVVSRASTRQWCVCWGEDTGGEQGGRHVRWERCTGGYQSES